MELKVKLNKPYTNDQKDEFIMNYAQNCYGRHKYDMTIKYVEDGIEAWGPTAQEQLDIEIARAKEQKKQEILQKLDSLDLKSIRAIRANDTEYIAQYEAEAQELREQLRELD